MSTSLGSHDAVRLQIDIGSTSLGAVMSQCSASSLDPGVRDRLASVLTLDLDGRTMDEYDAHTQRISEWILAQPGPVRVVSFYEHTRVAAAAVREAVGAPGLTRAVAERCRDRVAMTAAVAAGGGGYRSDRTGDFAARDL